MNDLEDLVERMSFPANNIKAVDMIAEIGVSACSAFNVMVYEFPESASPNVENLKNYYNLILFSKPVFDITDVKTYRVGKKASR